MGFLLLPEPQVARLSELGMVLVTIRHWLQLVAIYKRNLITYVLPVYPRQILVAVRPTLPHDLCVWRELQFRLRWDDWSRISNRDLICDLTLKPGQFWTQCAQEYVAVGVLALDHFCIHP